MVNFEWYRSFIEVYRVGTASRAAQILHLTQPAVSQHIAALESTLGYLLFQRSPRRMIPTEEGKRLYTQVAAAIEQLESIPTKNTASSAPQIIRIGTPQEFFTERILNQLPKNGLYTIRFGLTQELVEQLLEGQLDVVIATQKIARSDLDYQLILEENFWLVAPPDTIVPIAEDILQTDLTQLEQWLRGQAWIAYSEDLPIVRRFWRVVFGRRLDIKPRLILPDLRGIRQAIESGFGFSILPNYLCEEWVRDNKLTLILKPENAIKNQIWFVTRKGDRQKLKTKLLSDLWQAIAE
jgi:DNA-binding transcriptional LysR family regulator